MNKNDFLKLKVQVQKKFDLIRESLQVREKLLLRQVDLLIHSSSANSSSTSHSLLEGDTQFLTEHEDELLILIRNYGKFNYDSINLAYSDIFKNEYDTDPQNEHDISYKCLEECAKADKINANDEDIVIDFSTNRRLLRDSIINITVKETKELIEGHHRIEPLAVSPIDLSSGSISPTDTLSITTMDDRSTKSSQTEVPVKKKRSFRPKITINNCNGIINLRNIANITINCAKESSLRKEESARKECSEGSEREEDTFVTSTTNNEDNEGNCEFYNRLLNEIKNSLLTKKTPTYPLPHSEDEEVTPVETSNEDVLATPDSTNEEIGNEKRFVLKNFENLKIILETANGTDLHPVQIEQWLAEIVSETEVEPNIGEIFEHSEITS
ncbi:hypothetical protein ACFFRR_011927 [Megaselia abdita]